MSMRHASQRGNVRCPAVLICHQPNGGRTAVCAPGYTGRKRGEVVRTRTTALQMHTRQWVGTYAGKGNGDYQGELASARRPITAYLKHFAFPPEMALVRLDGAYGDATVVAGLLRAGISSVPRWRGYLLLESPRIQLVLAHAPTASVTRRNSGEVVELFALWLAGAGGERLARAGDGGPTCCPCAWEAHSGRQAGGGVGLRTVHHDAGCRGVPGGGCARTVSGAWS
jgi:hypothetical protein